MKRGFVILFIAISCTSREPAPVPVVTDYLPVKKGEFQIYNVDSVVVNQDIETAYNYELKTEVADSFPNAEGGFTYVIQRSKRIDANSPWTSLESWSLRVSPFQAVVNEGNISFVKIAGPLNNDKAWDGNALNILGGTEKCFGGDAYSCDNYTIDSFAKPFELSGGKSFANTMTVIESDNKDFIVFLDKRLEIYAKDTGLIYREIVQLNYCTDPGCLGTQFVESGLRYKQSINDYGGF